MVVEYSVLWFYLRFAEDTLTTFLTVLMQNRN